VLLLLLLLLECTATYLLVVLPHTATSKCKHFEIEGITPCLAIGVTTMCKELLRAKRGEKADFKFILGHPSLRPTLTAEHKAAFELLIKESARSELAIFVAAAVGKIDVKVLTTTSRRTTA
jgi:hypothetical protein